MKTDQALSGTFLAQAGWRWSVGAALWLGLALSGLHAQDMPLQPPLVYGLGGTGHLQKPTKSVCLNAHEVRLLVERAEVIPVPKALQSVRARLTGEVVKVRLCPEQEQLIYYVTLLDKNGQISVVGMDARTGHFLVKP